MTTPAFPHQGMFIRHWQTARSWRQVVIKTLYLWILILFIIGRSLVAHAGQPRYVYDDSGRLKAVVDLTGNTAIYNYDAVGNLLSITHQASSLLSLIDFSPKSGPIGATVWRDLGEDQCRDGKGGRR